MMGVNVISYSHFDEYLVDFSSFVPGPIAHADQVFAVPGLCKEKQQQQQGQGSMGGAAAGLLGTLAAMPWAHLPGEGGRPWAEDDRMLALLLRERHMTSVKTQK
jgi:hypothetical protein